MAKRVSILTVCITLLVSVVVNIYLVKQRSELISTGSFALSEAYGHLQTAVNMPIGAVPDNSPAAREGEVASAAAYLTSAAYFLDKRGVAHVAGIAQALYLFSFDLPYPNVVGKSKVSNEWAWIVKTQDELQSVETAQGIDLSQLKAGISNLYSSMPISSAQRQSLYSLAPQ
ncbi:hypothetical protein [Alicyclobacillus fodiniaquatilis]|uniref:DUF4825 domain-containing protein n=1 Tax=Alicyclobacillus fodiniaquatilis TaxID=1661150 RepID=A0ABW4JRY6_9BACL